MNFPEEVIVLRRQANGGLSSGASPRMHRKRELAEYDSDVRSLPREHILPEHLGEASAVRALKIGKYRDRDRCIWRSERGEISPRQAGLKLLVAFALFDLRIDARVEQVARQESQVRRCV